ncbi:EF-hand domain-containing protein [Candidatus Halobeggiatoa sp. HSG11]|nr:EF-hand domain-containing protein [Candidatus Halobeggiatoa sp. HSG11]
MKTILSSAIILSLTMGATIAIADSTSTNKRADRFAEKFDVNQDGVISGDEVQFVLAEKFANADADGNGSLTQEEMSAARELRHQERAAEHFTNLDADSSGSLTQEEMSADRRGKRHSKRVTKRFAKLDTDSNGLLTVEEFQAGKLTVGKRGDKAERMFSRMDLDGDGLLSSIELNTPLLEKIESMDTDQNGIISAEELSNASFGHRRGGKHRGKRNDR